MDLLPGQIIEVPDEKHLLLPSEEIKRRLREKAELLAEMNVRVQQAPVIQEHGAPLKPAIETKEFGPALTGRITADGRRLWALTSKAKKLDRISYLLDIRANEAKQQANAARAELNAYMRENGLAP